MLLYLFVALIAIVIFLFVVKKRKEFEQDSCKDFCIRHSGVQLHSTDANKFNFTEEKINVLNIFIKEYAYNNINSSIPRSVFYRELRMMMGSDSLCEEIRRNNMFQFDFRNYKSLSLAIVYSIIRYINICNILFESKLIEELVSKRKCYNIVSGDSINWIQVEEWHKELDIFLQDHWFDIYNKIKINQSFLEYASRTSQLHRISPPRTFEELVENVSDKYRERNIYYQTIEKCIIFFEYDFQKAANGDKIDIKGSCFDEERLMNEYLMHFTDHKEHAHKEGAKSIEECHLLNLFEAGYVKNEACLSLPQEVRLNIIKQHLQDYPILCRSLFGGAYFDTDYSDIIEPSFPIIKIVDIVKYLNVCESLYVNDYLAKLSFKRAILIKKDEYDSRIEIEEDWHKELSRFLNSHYQFIYPELELRSEFHEYCVKKGCYMFVPPENVNLLLGNDNKTFSKKNLYYTTIDICVKNYRNEFQDLRSEHIGECTEFDALDFEKKVSTIFQKFGWIVCGTPVTGDQGADVIAQFREDIAVIQCKYYSGSVGNKAVQEVIAARLFYNASMGIVVSRKCKYTKSAIDLAEKSHIILLCESNIENFLIAHHSNVDSVY